MVAQRPSVLIVDDRPANRRMVARVLGTLNVDILLAGDGYEALEIAGNHAALCVAILDVRMPEMDGYTLALELRDTAAGAALPMIFISAIDTEPEHRLRAYELGAVDFLTKPVSPRVLLSKVRVFLDLYLKRRELEATNAALQRQTTRLETTASVSHQITAILDLDELLLKFLTLVSDHFGYRYSGIWMRDDGPEADVIVLRAGNYVTTRPVLAPGSTVPLDASPSIVAHVYRSGEVYVTNDAYADPHYLTEEGLESVRSELALPLHFGEALLGVLDIQSDHLDAFSPGDITALSTLADQVAVAMRNGRLYAEIRRLNEDLESQVQERTAELEHAYHQLELLDKSKSDFITVVSHELRTPLTLISGFSQMLGEDAEIIADRFRNQQVSGIIAGAQRMRAIVDSMLDVVKIDSRTLQLDRGQVDLHELLMVLAVRLAPALQQRGQTLAIEHLNELPLIEADGTELVKVFDELLSNAVKYTPDGGTLKVSGRRLNAGADLQEQYVEVIVEDSGIGIAADQLELIFAKFYRTGETTLHSSGRTKFKAGGPGLGLPLARGIVEAHGGHLWGESSGHDEVKLPGAAFHVVLPVKQPVL